MIYKSMLLSILLVPLTIMCDKTEGKIHIEQLTNDLQAKTLELSGIEKKIQEKEELIDAIMERGGKIFYVLYEALDEAEKKPFVQEVDSFEKDVMQTLLIEKDIAEYFVNGFLNKHKSNRKEIELERIRFVLIRQAVEFYFLKKLFKSYEQCLQELLAIEAKLRDL